MKKERDREQLKLYRAKRSKHVKTWRANTKRKIVELLGGECRVCGYSKCYSALHTHHVDPSTKEYKISRMRERPQSWAKIEAEIKKCILLCANCHAEAHEGLIDLTRYQIIFRSSIQGECAPLLTENEPGSIPGTGAIMLR